MAPGPGQGEDEDEDEGEGEGQGENDGEEEGEVGRGTRDTRHSEQSAPPFLVLLYALPSPPVQTLF